MGPAELALYLAAGTALGAMYFALLLRTVRLHACKTTAVRIIPLYLVRFVVAASAFWTIAQQGAPALLLGLLGFLIARFAAQYRMRSA